METARPLPALIDVTTVRAIADLARLHLGPDEEAAMVSELARVVDYVAMLSRLDVSEVPATIQAGAPTSELRDDDVAPSLDTAQVLVMAPEPMGSGFGVPKIVE